MKKALATALVPLVVADPSFMITELDKPKKLYVMSQDQSKVQEQSNGFTADHDVGMQLGQKDSNGGYQPESFYKPAILGGSIRYDVNLSQTKCGCNAAVTLVSQPGYDQNGNPEKTPDGTYYCDASTLAKNLCPELDIMEANMYAWHTTVHRCDAPYNKHYSNCDHDGCVLNVHQHSPNAYGPGAQYTINTLHWLTVQINFEKGSDNHLEAISLDFWQDQNHIKVSTADGGSCSADKLRDMTGALQTGMTMAMSNWGDQGTNLSWLDGDTGCQENCNNSPAFQVRDIRYTPQQVVYTYGQPCRNPHDGECGDSCSTGNCDFSWPAGDARQWNSPDAACRCKPAGQSEVNFLQ